MSTNGSRGRQWRIFYAYTAWSIVGMMFLPAAGIALVLGLSAATMIAAHPVSSLLIALQLVLSAWSAFRTIETWSRRPQPTSHGRWDLPQVGRLSSDGSLILAVVPAVALVVPAVTTSIDDRLLVVSAGTLLTTVLIRVTWWWVLAAFAGMILLGVALGLGTPASVASAAMVLAAVLTIRFSLWLAAVVRELDEAREAQTRLAVAEERLRFARDLHDVSGRDLSAIAVKSELVAQLAEREDPRAVEHSSEVAQIARSSLAEIRALVRGYREADLAAELRGTVSLLRSAHVAVEVRGAADEVPAEHADAAAWVLREGGTNMLRHAAPEHVTIGLDRDGICLRNDGAPEGDTVLEGSGLTGMRERLGEGAALDARLEHSTFTLAVRFTTSPPATDTATTGE